MNKKQATTAHPNNTSPIDTLPVSIAFDSEAPSKASHTMQIFLLEYVVDFSGFTGREFIPFLIETMSSPDYRFSCISAKTFAFLCAL